MNSHINGYLVFDIHLHTVAHSLPSLTLFTLYSIQKIIQLILIIIIISLCETQFYVGIIFFNDMY